MSATQFDDALNLAFGAVMDSWEPDLDYQVDDSYYLDQIAWAVKHIAAVVHVAAEEHIQQVNTLNANLGRIAAALEAAP